MVLRDRIWKLERGVQGNRDYLELCDGTRFYFQPMRALAALFVRQMDALRVVPGPALSEGADGTETPPPAKPYAPEILEALAKAPPDSLRRFERRYGPAGRSGAVIHNDGTVTVRSIAVDGSSTTQELEGEEAQEYRASIRPGG